MNILKQGDNGNEVTDWQRTLIRLGFNLIADGDFGAKTVFATKAFQASQNLETDGIVGEATKNAAIASIASKTGIPPITQPVQPVLSPLLSAVHPNLSAKVQRIIELAKAEGFTIKPVQGLRTFAEQDALYAQGRTKAGKKVTNAKGGQSNHNYGMAVDFVFVVNGQATYTPESLYHNIGRWAETVGLDWGGNWKFTDLPHVQLKGIPNWTVLLPIYHQGGLPEIWNTYQG